VDQHASQALPLKARLLLVTLLYTIPERYWKDLLSKVRARAERLQPEMTVRASKSLACLPGTPTHILIVIEHCSPYGRLAMATSDYGMAARQPPNLDPNDPWHPLPYLTQVRSGALDPTMVITHRLGLEEVSTYIASLEEESAGHASSPTTLGAHACVSDHRLCRAASFAMHPFTQTSAANQCCKPTMTNPALLRPPKATRFSTTRVHQKAASRSS
jgi:hypothetical protein